jgi:hypothetical protein
MHIFRQKNHVFLKLLTLNTIVLYQNLLTTSDPSSDFFNLTLSYPVVQWKGAAAQTGPFKGMCHEIIQSVFPRLENPKTPSISPPHLWIK